MAVKITILLIKMDEMFQSLAIIPLTYCANKNINTSLLRKAYNYCTDCIKSVQLKDYAKLTSAP